MNLLKDQDKGREFDRIHHIEVNLHKVSHSSGCRPSDLFEWTNPDEWLERLMFDLDIITNTWEEVISTNNRG